MTSQFAEEPLGQEQATEAHINDQKDREVKDSGIRRRVLFGTASNFTGQIFVFAVSFLLTPFILNQLGATVYGLWILLGSVVAYGAVLDLGIWGTIIKYVAEYQAQGNNRDARALLTTVLYVYVGIALIIILAGVATAPFLPRLFNLSPEQQPLARQLIVLMSISTGLAIPCMFPLAILRGLQRYEVVNSIDIVSQVIMAGATVAVLLWGGGVIGLVLVNLFTLIVPFGAGLWAIHRLAPEMRFGLRGAKWQMARTIFTYSWPLFLRDMATRLQTRTDEITIGIFLPVSAVGAYNIARRLSEATQTLTRQFMKTLLPLASQLHAEGDYGRLRHVYKAGTRLTIAIVLGLSAVLIVLAGPILTVWVGAEFAIYASVVLVLTLANLFATMQWPAMAVQQAMTRHRIFAISSLGNGVANLVLSLLLVRPFGLIGVALGTAIPTAIEYFCVILPYSLRVVGVRPREALQEIFLPALIPAIPTFLTLYALRNALQPSSLFTIGVIAAAGIGVYALVYVGYIFILRPTGGKL